MIYLEVGIVVVGVLSFASLISLVLEHKSTV